MTLHASIEHINSFFKEMQEFAGYFTGNYIMTKSDNAKYSHADNFLLRIPEVMTKFESIHLIQNKMASVYLNAQLEKVINKFEMLYKNILHIRIIENSYGIYNASFATEQDEEIAKLIFGCGLGLLFKTIDTNLLLILYNIENLKQECVVCYEVKRAINIHCSYEHHLCIPCFRTIINDTQICPICRGAMLQDNE